MHIAYIAHSLFLVYLRTWMWRLLLTGMWCRTIWYKFHIYQKRATSIYVLTKLKLAKNTRNVEC